MIERWRTRIAEGMTVRTSDGEKLGKVVACQPGGFVVEKGFLFPKDTTVPYDRVAEIKGGEILVSLSRADLGEPNLRAVLAPAIPAAPLMSANGPKEPRVTEEERARMGSLDQFGKSSEICVSLVEEEVIASKHVERIGEVHVRKEIITEEKQITVPVTREVLRVERIPVTHEVRAGDKPFEKESYDFPISEEHITVEKHAVVREEIRIGKDIQQGEETASTTVRRERAEIETMGPVRRAEVSTKDLGPRGSVAPSGVSASAASKH